VNLHFFRGRNQGAESKQGFAKIVAETWPPEVYTPNRNRLEPFAKHFRTAKKYQILATWIKFTDCSAEITSSDFVDRHDQVGDASIPDLDEQPAGA